MAYQITLIPEEFENGSTGEKVPGYTIVVDGAFRRVLDGIIAYPGSGYQDYSQVLGAALTRGITDVINSLKDAH